ncbi:iron-containing alcohol dehydrogenase [Filobacillus milosensis]|uniref:Iron-containing alcohol dehydrogenase n=1 Tax=Filobacillus milosensis TaxID=94137 RepID=A0A4Y8ICU0_9BACI|nr:iron-containing alcohol dehydrogenase [Filobacillus milosensis]TFB13782.1 iron-containing alcohol dehydrogenase [Filobacillus milosensis]
MENFIYYNPTKLVFGRGQLENLDNLMPEGVKRVLITYGGGSVKRNGIFANVQKKLNDLGYEVLEFGGIEPNPRLSTVNKGAQFCKDNEIDFLLAVGGGSVIDCTKTIAAASKYDGDAWDLVTKKVQPEDALPLGTVLTLAATGSEMNAGAVITNWETNEKYGWGSPHLYPQFSILNPVHTYSVPMDQTVYGIVDMMSHIFEQYFHQPTNSPVQDRMCEGVLRTIIETAPKLINNLDSYEYRETIMYAGTIALNGMLQMGYRGDWASHNIEHAVSAVYDIPHAGGLAIIFPNWMKHNLDVQPERFKQMATRVFGVNPEGKTDREVGLEGIERLSQFWTALGAPSRLADYDIDDSKLDLMVDRAMKNGPFGNFNKLQDNDVKQILTMSL